MRNGPSSFESEAGQEVGTYPLVIKEVSRDASQRSVLSPRTSCSILRTSIVVIEALEPPRTWGGTRAPVTCEQNRKSPSNHAVYGDSKVGRERWGSSLFRVGFNFSTQVVLNERP